MNTKMEMKARGRVLLGSDERGMVMVLTLLVMVILVILGSVLVVTSLTENQISSNDAAAIQALYVADAGMQRSLNSLNTGGTGVFATPVTVGSGQFTASVTAAAPPAGQKRIEAYGYVPNSTSARGVKKVSMLVYRTSPFKWGAYGDTDLGIGGSGSFGDSYDSENGPYDPATANSNCSLRSNGDITLNGDTVLKGTMTAGGVCDGYTPGNITGAITAGAAYEAPPPVLPLPSIPYTPAGSGPGQIPSGTGISYNATTGELVVGGGNNITLTVPTDPTVYYFSNLSLTGGSTMIFNNPSGYHVDIYISGKLVVGGGGFLNPTNDATKLTIWACGSATKPEPFSLTGGSQAYYAVYAPDRLVVCGGGGHLVGSIIGKSVDFTGGSDLTYDEALARQPGNGKYAVAPRSWTELNP